MPRRGQDMFIRWLRPLNAPTAGLYMIITDEKTVSEDGRIARVCGKQMDVTKGSSILRYELVKMPDGTNV